MKSKKEIIEDHFFRPRWYSVFINPYFIDRYTLFKAIKYFSQEIKENVKILDVGYGIKPYKNLFKTDKYFGIDIETSGHSNDAKYADKFYDGKNIPFEDNSFDVIICTQVLEHTEEPQTLIKEIYRVMKKDSVAFLTIPFVGNEHEQPYDFWRFTQFGNKKLLEEAGFKKIEIKPSCGFFETFGQMFSSFIFESMNFRNSSLKLVLSIVLLAPIQIISIVLDFIIPNNRLNLNYIITARK